MIYSKALSKLAAICLCLNTLHIHAQETQKVDPSSSIQQKADKGWFFYEEPVKPKEPVRRTPAAQQAPAKDLPDEEKKKCFDKETWIPECGFVDPGKDMEFQAKQRDGLLNNMALSKNDPRAVEKFQYYMKYVMERASEVSNNWYFNMVQNPELDPKVNAPVTPFGLSLMSKMKSNQAQDLYKALRDEKAIFLFFTRNDCVYCHQAAPVVKKVSKETGIPVYNAALDETCMQGMEEGCKKGNEVIEPATRLGITIVPTLVLYIPPKGFMKIAVGINDEYSIKSRISSFFNAYRTALLKGVNNSNGLNPSVDFSNDTPKGTAQTGIKVPNESDVKKMLTE